MSFATGGMVHCCDCGDSFHRAADEAWKVRCVPCFVKRKNKQPDSNPWKVKAETLESVVDALESEVELLKGQLWNRARPEPTSLDRELKDHLRALLQYCHPDKHNGSQGATQVTEWLNDVKRRLPCA